jgi:hypothetical protein
MPVRKAPRPGEHSRAAGSGGSPKAHFRVASLVEDKDVIDYGEGGAGTPDLMHNFKYRARIRQRDDCPFS